MSRYKNGNPKYKSRFICMKCMKENQIGTGIQRTHGQREKAHIKDLYCLNCKEITKSYEVRYMDDIDEAWECAEEIRSQYY